MAACDSRCFSYFYIGDLDLARLVASVFPPGQMPQTGIGIRESFFAIGIAESGSLNPATGIVQADAYACGDACASLGIWQIDTLFHPQYTPDQLFDPLGNARAAFALSNGGLNGNPWCSWEASACGGNGRATYRAFLPRAQAAIAAVTASPPSPPPVPPITPVGNGVTPAAAGGLTAEGALIALAGVLVGGVLVQRSYKKLKIKEKL